MLIAGTGAAEHSTDLQPVTFETWDEVLADLHGQIVVVDYRAGWCSPCIERFPLMVEMHHRYRDRGVQFISLNLDEQGDDEAIEWANDFLSRINAEIPNYHMDENMTEAFERLNLLGLPAVGVMDRSGDEARRLSGDNPFHQFTEQDVEEAVLELLDQASS
jgi:thiol-disulfide isomerase/thioredoxin